MPALCASACHGRAAPACLYAATSNKDIGQK